MPFALEIALFFLAFLGVLLTLVGVPGNFGPVFIALGYWLTEGEPRFTGAIVLVFLALAASGEVVEQFAAIVGAKKFGASKSGMIGAFVGSIIGGVVGTMLVPIIGTVIGVFAGCFAFTLAFEVKFAGRDIVAGVRAGWGAVVGKAAAAAYKYAMGFALLGLLAWRFWFV
jgi:uncharacterized protein YqgC (DUF456 family)